MWSIDDMKRWLSHLPLLLAATLLIACTQEEPLTLGKLVVDEVTGNTIHCHVEVSGTPPDEYGFYYATSKDDVVSVKARKVEGTYSQGVISGVIASVNPYTTYYIRAYAMNVSGKRTTQIVAVTTPFGVPAPDDNVYPDVVYSGN